MERVLKTSGLQVKTSVTDRNRSVAKLLRQKHSCINHQFDVYLAKSIAKRISKLQQKKNPLIYQWAPSIINHLWWCVATSQGNVELLRLKWLSLGFHAANIHHWPEFEHFHQCTHETLDSDKKIAYFVPGTSEHDNVFKLLHNTTILNDMAHLTQYCHTGGLEVYQSHCLKWTPKRLHFQQDVMQARRAIAAMDYNANSDRSQRVFKQRAKPDFRFCYTKAQKKWIVKPIYCERQPAATKRLMCAILEELNCKTLETTPDYVPRK